MNKRTLGLVCIVLAIVLMSFGFMFGAKSESDDDWEKEGTGTVTVTPSSITASIVNYYPSDPNNPAIVYVGNSITISVTFKNTGSTAWKFLAAATIYDASGNVVDHYETTLDTALQTNEQKTVSWSHTVKNVGDYWLQFGIYKTKFAEDDRLDRQPSPSQRLIVGFTLPTIGSFSVTVPSQGSGTATISVSNPNTIPIKVTGFQLIDKGGFIGDIVLATNLPLEIAAGQTGNIQLSVVDKGSSASTYTIRFKLSGTP